VFFLSKLFYLQAQNKKIQKGIEEVTAKYAGVIANFSTEKGGKVLACVASSFTFQTKFSLH
jgi:hypothetical protein